MHIGALFYTVVWDVILIGMAALAYEEPGFWLLLIYGAGGVVFCNEWG